jgi:two-component system chemotaxis response regulator CheB
MLSSLSKEGSQITMEALALGAEDFIEKPGNNKENIAVLKEELQLKIDGINSEQKRRTKEKTEQKNTRIFLS